MPTLAGTVCMGLISIMVGAQVSIAAPKEPELKIANVVKGEKVFVRHCAGCHGSEGKGEWLFASGARAGQPHETDHEEKVRRNAASDHSRGKAEYAVMENSFVRRG